MNRYMVYGIDEDGKSVVEYIDAFSEEEALALANELARKSKTVYIAAELIGEEQ